MKVPPSLFLMSLALLLFCFPGESSAQVTYRISSETGLSRIKNRLSRTADQKMYGRFDLAIGFRKSQTKNKLLMEVRLRPEFYSGTDNLRRLRIWANVLYYKQLKQIEFFLTFRWKRTNYHLQTSSISLNFVQIGGILSRKLPKRRWIMLDFYYLIRDLTSPRLISMDAWVLKLSYQKNPYRFLKLNSGILVEKFFVEPLERIILFKSNRGLRIGAAFNLDYTHFVKIQFSYQLTAHQSDLIPERTWEHNLHFLIGKFFYEKWSVFFLVDYLQRKIQGVDDGNSLFYYSIFNIENRVYIKLGYDLSDRTQLYGRLGYINDEIALYPDYLRGWQGTIGIQISK